MSSPSNSQEPVSQASLEHLQTRLNELEARVASLQPGKPPLVNSGKRLVTVARQHVASGVTTVIKKVPRRLPPSLPLPRPFPVSSEKGSEAEAAGRDGFAEEERERKTVRSQPAPSPESEASLEDEETRLAELPLMMQLTGITLLSLLLGWASEYLVPFAFVPWVLYTIAYLNGSFYSIQEAWASLRQRQFDVNLLMIAAALGAALIGQPREGASLMFLFSLSQTLETFAMGRTHASIRALMDMTPKTARLVRTDTDGKNEHEDEVPIEQVAVGEVVRVRPGEHIPADGLVIRGTSTVNEASITGESMPVEKQPEARVFGGTVNGQGAMDVRVTTAIEDSTLARIVKIVREARERKARSQHFTDRIIGQYYAYTVVGFTLLAIVIPLVFLGWGWPTTIYRAITLMVAASPCALVISIPAAILSALASASWGGVLFKGGKHLETASRVQVVAFDKTGTLTTGRPGVVAVVHLSSHRSSARSSSSSQEIGKPGSLTTEQARLLTVAAAVERFSEHPLARAIVTAAQEHRLTLPEASDFEALAGAGVQARLDGRLVQVGRPSLFPQVRESSRLTDLAALIAEQEQQGRTVVLVGEPSRPWGVIALADTVRPESTHIVAALKQTGIRRVVLLTGDNWSVAERLGQVVGVDEVRAELTPEQKVETIRQIQASEGPVAMVGDGINDAPALASATLGIAMGAAGTDVAMESADVVLMRDELAQLPATLRLARRTRQVVRQNLVFAFAVMVVLVLLSLGGFLPLTLAMVGHEGSTLLVVANGLRLLAPWRSEPQQTPGDTSDDDGDDGDGARIESSE